MMLQKSTYSMMLQKSSYIMMLPKSSYIMILQKSSYIMMLPKSTYTMLQKSSYTMIPKSSYTMILGGKKQLSTMGKCDNRVLKEIAGYKRKKTQEAGINCKIKRFLIYIVNTLRYRVVTISKTR